MQANVDKITEAATATALFAEVSDRVFVEPVGFPALCVWRRRTHSIDKDESGLFWIVEWRYDTALFVDSASDFAGMETVEAGLDRELAKRKCWVSARSHYEATVGEREVVICHMTISRMERRTVVTNPGPYE